MPKGPKGAGCDGAHRFSWELHYGPIPPGIEVCHKCDNKPCVRPDHLWLDDQGGNIQDMLAKGRGATGDRAGARKHPERYPRGATHHNSKMTPEKVRLLRQRRAEGATYSQLIAEFGITTGPLADILKGRTWKHVI